MGRKLYVGNLPYTATDQDLADAFGEFGAVASAKVIMDRDSGRSKGFAFVEMTTDAEAQTAIEKLNGADYGGRRMNVSEARPQEPRENRGGGGGGWGGSRSNERSGGGDRW